MTDEWRVVYDSASQRVPVVFLLLGAAVGVAALRTIPGRGGRILSIAIAMFIITVLMGIGRPRQPVGEQSFTVSGIVREFVPGSWGGHTDESFVVDTVPFAYRFSVYRGGYNGAPWQRNPIKNPIHSGTHLRITYVHRLNHNVITRLEVLEKGPGEGP